jgi:hypothetical protein
MESDTRFRHFHESVQFYQILPSYQDSQSEKRDHPSTEYLKTVYTSLAYFRLKLHGNVFTFKMPFSL